MLCTAVADEVIVRNPCQVERAGVERAPERPVASVADVAALADAIAPDSGRWSSSVPGVVYDEAS